jgi:hypothetical protein
VTVEAYLYVAEDAPPPFELNLLSYIDRFGVRAVLGRDDLSAGEIRGMIMAENVVNAYLSRKASDNWGKWAADNPKMDELLKRIEVMVHAD